MRVDLMENKNSKELIIKLQDGQMPVNVGTVGEAVSSYLKFQLNDEDIIENNNDPTTLKPNSATLSSYLNHEGKRQQSEIKSLKCPNLNHEKNSHGDSRLLQYSPVITRIKESLEEKVRRLKLEKVLSEEKILLTLEEQKISALEKNRFQRELTMHRKLRLQKIVNQLKVNLKDQSERLQKSYSRVLDVQKLIYRRSFVVTHNLQANSKHNEAPF